MGEPSMTRSPSGAREGSPTKIDRNKLVPNYSNLSNQDLDEFLFAEQRTGPPFGLQGPGFDPSEVKFVVADFDAISSHDFIGQAGVFITYGEPCWG